jgi:ATP-binding cassette subfamily F protein uup
VAAGQRTLLSDVNWQLGPGERVGVIGANGSGKTTLLQLLAGPLPAVSAAAVPAPLTVSGQVVRGKTVRIGYLTQEPAAVAPGLRVLEAAEQVRSSVRLGGLEISASQLLDRLGLRGDRQWTPVAELSGGERRRLQLMLVLMNEPNVLLLDEPTNDLDIDTLTELEDMLDGWPGSMVAVSHDRYFLERACDHVVALIDGGLAYLPGGVEEYLARQDRQRAATQGPAATSPSAAQVSPGARQRAARKELASLERQLDRVSSREAELTTALAESASDYTRLIELGAQLRSVQQDKAALEDRWLAVAEELS